MKKREAIEKSLEQIPVQELKPGPEDALDNERQKMKPNLLKRIFGGFLDVLICGVFIAAIQILLYNTLYKPLGYFDATNRITELQLESHLYNDKDGIPVTISNSYDTNKSVEDNYDVAITYFYSHDERAIKNNKLQEYNSSKLLTYYTFDGENYVRTEIATPNRLESFYQEAYSNALDFFGQNKEFINCANKTFLITILSLLSNVVMVTTIYYFAIPLFNKKKQTLGQFINKIFVLDKESLQPETLKQHFIRFLVFDIVVIISPITLYLLLPESFAVPIFIHALILCFSHSNCGIHDFAGHTYVANISKTNSGEILDTLRKMGGK